MKNLSSTLDSEMYWVQPDVWNTQYELHTKDSIFQIFDYQRGFLKSSVNVQSSFGKWQLKRSSFVKPDIIVLDLETNAEIATYSKNFWSGGWVKFTTPNSKFLSKPPGFLQTKWVFENEQKHILFSLHQGAKEKKFSDLFKTQAIIEIKEHGYRYHTEELSLLLALAWWLWIIDSEDTAATTAMIAASS